jgi:hypothetical protein
MEKSNPPALALLALALAGLWVTHAVNSRTAAFKSSPRPSSKSSILPSPSSPPIPTTTPLLPAHKPTPASDYSSLCIEANQTYDDTSSSIFGQEQTEYAYIQSQENTLTQAQYTAELNQLYSSTNSSLESDYSGYLENVHAVPDCTADFSAPALFPTSQ